MSHERAADARTAAPATVRRGWAHRAWLPWAVALTVVAVATGIVAALGGFVLLPGPPMGEEVKPAQDGSAIVKTKEWDFDIRSVTLESSDAYRGGALVVGARIRNKRDAYAYAPPSSSIAVQVGKGAAPIMSCQRTYSDPYPPDVWVPATCTLDLGRSKLRVPPKGAIDKVAVMVLDQVKGDSLDGSDSLQAGPIKAHVWLPVKDRR